MDTTSTAAVYSPYLPTTSEPLPLVSTGEQKKSKSEISISRSFVTPSPISSYTNTSSMIETLECDDSKIQSTAEVRATQPRREP